MRQLFLDTETTGLDPEQGHRIIEVAVVEYIDRQPTGREFQSYINPNRDIDPDSYRIHGLDNEFLATYPNFCEIAKGLFDFIRDAEVIIHNAPFDVGFLNAEITRCNQSQPSPFPQLDQLCRIEDSLQLARNKYGGRNDLDSLCDRLNITNTNRELHGALIDANLLAKVYIAMTSSQGNLDLSLQTATQQTQHSPQDLHFLRVVKASDKEQKEHLAYMQELQK